MVFRLFQLPGVPMIKDRCNPATWMLEINSPTAEAEAQLNVDSAEIYANSELYRRNQVLIKEISMPTAWRMKVGNDCTKLYTSMVLADVNR